jgi:hypothetical protein
MWRDFQIDEIDKDLISLEKIGAKILRVFPLWSDFQPISPIFTQEGKLLQVVDNHNNPVLDNGIDPVMTQRLASFLDLAESHGFKVIISLLTGWMSGRLFVPTLFFNRNVLTDPLCLIWEKKYVQGIVNEFKRNKTIIAWDLGNECNCMAEVSNREQARLWTSFIADSIKILDNRPIISGMHSLDASTEGIWVIEDQANYCDVLTTHPYDYWVPYCLSDSINSTRSVLHSVGESCLYSSIGEKPCIVEEIGTMGPMIADEIFSENYLKTTLFSCFFNGIKTYLWWCAFDQDNLTFPPYSYMGCERELGLMTSDRKLKNFAKKLPDYLKSIAEISFLPSKESPSVECLLTDGIESWPVSFGSYILARQSGLDISFRLSNQLFKNRAKAYILPSIKGNRVIAKKSYSILMDYVKLGSSLLITLDDGFLSPFESFTGVKVSSFKKAPAKKTIQMKGFLHTIEMGSEYELIPTTAEILAENESGHPVFFRNKYGKGWVYTYAYPIEKYVGSTPAIASDEMSSHFSVYKEFSNILDKAFLNKNEKNIIVSEHIVSDTEVIVCLINCSKLNKEIKLDLNNGFVFKEAIIGSVKNNMLFINTMDIAVLRVIKI